MFSIGEFSKVTGLTVKTLRFYHEQGVLTPTFVDSGSGYRYYAESKVETARIVVTLRELGFSMREIVEILDQHDDDSTILAFLENRKREIELRLKHDRHILENLKKIIRNETEALKKMSESNFDIQEKTVPSMQVASIRMQGKYSDCGAGFGKIFRKFGRHACGKPMMLIRDTEYRENDANFEVAVPIKKGSPTDDVEIQELPGGTCVSLFHQGPYSELHRSYAIILKYAQDKSLRYSVPSREIYHKGPGMIFRGNPKNYLTEIQLFVDE